MNKEEEALALAAEDNQIPAFARGPRAKAAFVILVRNSDLQDMRKTLREVEDRFNRNFNYPYVFLNDEPFTEEFKTYTQSLTKAECKYGLIPKEHWSYPSWIDQTRAKEAREDMKRRKIIYGGSESYRNMCRYESGFFYRHPLMLEYDYYWRVEPGVHFHCDIDFDPFMYMQTHNKTYSFTVSLYEYVDTIPTLWKTTKDFMKKHPEHIAKDNSLGFISNDNGATYNLCHFWSNFEIASTKFLRSPAYSDYFDYLDQAGGFFYERWGDAPVHSIAAALFLPRDKIHFFNEIGYTHSPFTHCPVSEELQRKCHCNPKDNFDDHGYSCTKRWLSQNW
ncbi:putative mannosyltransferase [Piptocephalis cylindrospora]|uniref:Putative mannosyltransferase n=1 Tax=Piptocephalis cylindrospora TaxID=1907219 RepID=A0A4P9Y3T3_9FUNG|nr:putative mannosyltransferase [Piptocephalis cylindrospora]|eukprot:RKP12470.1 putative mannosyltransferase [Piptocephalis cylindrospora]